MTEYTLDEILKYQNDNVVSSFRDSFDIDEESAKDIFIEMLRFLWFCDLRGSREFATIDHPIVIIDEMWHQFILTTRDYTDFCNRYFGKYIHHGPTTLKEKIGFLQKKKNGSFGEDFLKEKRRKYEYVYDQLGETVFLKWYEHYPTRYSQEIIKSIRKK